ncbi:ribonuclease III [Lophiostoma macrostomum CBS 122681]|uniref:Ribonuclease III n=1 Tax=Lophiostoma macrostomum CBS 122681 TaxID=1314788 RepID=A0A6A6T3N3_9PLEO|nr:ribonuclease III [Lophiostoma macrostomum CBS 122681]
MSIETQQQVTVHPADTYTMLKSILRNSQSFATTRSRTIVHTGPIPHPSPAVKIEKCEEILNYKFINKRVCLEALQSDAGARVYFSDEWLKIPNNKQLAHHGDIIFDYILSTKWVRNRSTKKPFHVVKNTVLTNNALYGRGVELGIDKCILKGPTQRDKPVTVGMVASTFEALIGAVHLDGGIKAAKAVVRHLGFRVPSREGKRDRARARN